MFVWHVVYVLVTVGWHANLHIWECMLMACSEAKWGNQQCGGHVLQVLRRSSEAALIIT